MYDAVWMHGCAVVVCQGSASMISWAAGEDNYHRTQHIERRSHFTREASWSDSIIDVRYCPTVEMLADILRR